MSTKRKEEENRNVRARNKEAEIMRYRSSVTTTMQAFCCALLLILVVTSKQDEVERPESDFNANSISRHGYHPPSRFQI
ncbi:hypothetical protein L9F63_007357, partial [Diploptera punctata]